MARIAFIELIVCWLAWVYPFLFRAQHQTHRKAVVMAPRAKWGLLLESLGFFLAWLHIPRTPLSGDGWAIASMIIGPIGPLLSWTAVAHLGRQFRIQAGLYDDHQLVRTGPYSIVRHPIYASMLAMLLSTALLMAPWPLMIAAVVLFLAGTEIRVRSEEGLLAGRFGPAFEAYRRKVPAYLPFLR